MMKIKVSDTLEYKIEKLSEDMEKFPDIPRFLILHQIGEKEKF